jgi:hypothetical protein
MKNVTNWVVVFPNEGMSTLVFIKMIKFKKGGSLGDVLQKY